MNMLPYILLFLLATFSACGLLGGEGKEPLEPGPRNYEWRVDTLFSPPGGFIYDIWGSSPGNMWAVAGTGINNLWHFNGEEWKVWPERVGPSFYSIFGFAQDDIWMGGNDGKLYHFNGEEWILAYQYEVEGMRGADMRSIWGNSPTDIYVAGNIQPIEGPPWESFLLHYDGNHWKELFRTDFGVLFQRVRTVGNSAFLQSLDRDNSPTLLQFHQFNNNLKEIFSIPKSKVTWTSLNKIGNDIIYVIGDTFFTYRNGKFKKIKTVTEPNFGYQIYGRSKKDIFLRMEDGLSHYNGEDTQYLFNLNHSLMSNAIIFETEVLFIVRDYEQGANYIYHGTLTNN